MDSTTHEILVSNFFANGEAAELLHDLLKHDIYPIVYSLQDGEEKFSYMENCISKGTRDFIVSRGDDARRRPVQKLRPLYERYRSRYHCVFQVDIYSQEHWLELMPPTAAKSHAIRQLADYLGCE